MLRNRPECLSPGANKKLHPHNSGPFKILKKIGPNAYVLDLPPDLGLNAIFNVEDLTLYKGHDHGSPSEEHEIQLPSSPAPANQVVDLFDDHVVSTRQGGFHKFLIDWKNHPISDAT